MPNEASIIPEVSPVTSETKERYRTYFQGLIDELREVHRFTNARAGQPQNWYTFASENSRIYKYSTSFAQGGRIRVEIYIDCGDKVKNEQIFDCLFEHKQDIETLLGSELAWEKLDGRRACRIAVYRDEDIDVDSETLEDIKNWTVKNLLNLRTAFPSFFQKCI
ncbi:MAG: DUF4268 domain-containing protein [Thiothrix sp.]